MLAVAGQNAESARAVLRDFYDRGLSEAEKAAANIVLDFDAAEMTCPACLATFATGPDRCPDCGLAFGA